MSKNTVLAYCATSNSNLTQSPNLSSSSDGNVFSVCLYLNEFFVIEVIFFIQSSFCDCHTLWNVLLAEKSALSTGGAVTEKQKDFDNFGFLPSSVKSEE